MVSFFALKRALFMKWLRLQLSESGNWLLFNALIFQDIKVVKNIKI